MMNFFGKKKTTTTTNDINTSSSVSATSQIKPEDPQQTIIKIRENIDAQEKRYVSFSIKNPIGRTNIHNVD
jgi:hypothetical protein